MPKGVNKNIVWLWRAVPPSDEYVALGFVGSATPATPPSVATENFRCVHRSLVVSSPTSGSVPEMTVTSASVAEPPKPLWRYRGRSTTGGKAKLEGEGAPASFWPTADGQSTLCVKRSKDRQCAGIV